MLLKYTKVASTNYFTREREKEREIEEEREKGLIVVLMVLKVSTEKFTRQIFPVKTSAAIGVLKC